MQTPVKVTLEGFYQARKGYLAEKCHFHGVTGRMLCRKCGERIKMVAAKVEIHEAGNGQCVGNGERFEAGIPYCPGCEELPAAEGCVHA